MRIHVPYRPDGGQRDRLWQACSRRWATLFADAEIHTGDHDGEPFNRSAARNQAAVGDWLVAVFADADVMVEGCEQVDAAVALATRTGQMVFAHTWRAGLGEDATGQVLAGAEPATVEHEEWDRNTYSGCYAVPRSLWNAVGGFDERYQGWGYEDLAFMRACAALGGVERVPGTIYHLWHPRSRAMQEEQPHYRDNQLLWERYMAADRDPVAMREVLAR